MVLPPRIRLSEAEKDALLLEQAALIERLAARIAALEAAIGKPQKTSSNSHLPPSKDGPGRGDRPKRPRRKRPSRPGKSRPLTETPDDKTERRMASECGHCGMGVSGALQRRHQRYDHIELPIIRPVVTRVELFGGRWVGAGTDTRRPGARDHGARQARRISTDQSDLGNSVRTLAALMVPC